MSTAIKVHVSPALVQLPSTTTAPNIKLILQPASCSCKKFMSTFSSVYVQRGFFCCQSSPTNQEHGLRPAPFKSAHLRVRRFRVLLTFSPQISPLKVALLLTLILHSTTRCSIVCRILPPEGCFNCFIRCCHLHVSRWRRKPSEGCGWRVQNDLRKPNLHNFT